MSARLSGAPNTRSSSSIWPTTSFLRFLTSRVVIVLPLHLFDDHEPAVRPGDRAADEQEVLLRVDPDHLEVLDGHLGSAHVTGHPRSGNDARRVCRGSDRAGGAVEHRAVRAATAGE